MKPDEKREWLRCAESPLYFIDRYCQIYDATRGEWLPFRLWPAQAQAVRAVFSNFWTIILKARQLGMTWLVLAVALWLCLFRPAATVLIFSKRDDEAVYLLGLERLRGMYARLPSFLRVRAVVNDNEHEWALSNGSVVRAFPTSAGDSYTATLAIVDEADLVPDLNRLMRAVKPTIDGGGRMILLSRSNKREPQSEFKRIYRAARENVNGWCAVFLPWHSRPSRDAVWYEAQRNDILRRTGSLDDLHEQYPATDVEALAPRALDKRIAPQWLEQCYVASSQYAVANHAPPIPALRVYQGQIGDVEYVLAADPAEGNPTSDPSALTVLRRDTGEQVAELAGQYEPSTFAAHIDAIGRWYRAAVLVERNNHGHAVLLWLRDHSALTLLCGNDGREGWQTNTNSKALMYSVAASAFRDRETMIHSFETLTQLQSIEGSTLSAPSGEHDDQATCYALALVARNIETQQGGFVA